MAADMLRWSLARLACIYKAVIRTRNAMYSVKILRSSKINVPVLSVGNITAGGTGKTPLVIWLANYLSSRGLKCCILTRGYKSKQANCTDEPAVISHNCPTSRIIINPNRVSAAKTAVEKYGCDAFVMDDGFQHRRLARDIDIVTIDATNPFGYDKLLPAGLLREPLDSLKRAHAAILTRTDQISESQLAAIEDRLIQINKNLVIARSIHQPASLKTLKKEQIPLEQIKNKNVLAFCGIGNPDSFFQTIRSCGANLLKSIAFDDHYDYTADDISDIFNRAIRIEADYILTTQKDWTKTVLLATNRNDPVTFAYLFIELKFTAGDQKITELIENLLVGRIEQLNGA
ncbi:MAG: tetraacyldisaccharide 4'-kinase [Phycisphaerae bacterium]|nr:tetraacyldisaccharide 4'-kinase [Phycisphaerae bacterium]